MRRLLAILLAGACTASPARTLYDANGLKLDGSLNLRLGFRHGENINYGLGAVRGFGSLTPTGETSRNDLQMAIKPALLAEYALDGGEIYAGFLPVAATTTLDGELSGQFARSGDQATAIDSAYLGYRRGVIDISYGPQDFSVGDGFIIGDGIFNQGHDDGQYWTGAFSAWRNAGVLKVNTAPVRADAFWLRADGDLGDARVAGLNVEGSDGERFGRLGLMYFTIFDDNGVAGFDGMHVYGVRGADLHWPSLPQLKLYGEYVAQRGENQRTGQDNEGDAWYVESSYQFVSAPWKPRLYYRFAHFSGDDLATPEIEEYRGLFFTIFKRDWDTWYHGEIAGEFHLFLQNQVTHMAKLRVYPTATTSVGLWYYNHSLDTPQYFGMPLTETEWSDELNLAVEYTPDDRFYWYGAIAWSTPGPAARQVYGHGRDMYVLQTYISYTFK